jgi:hypothetical protein
MTDSPKPTPPPELDAIARKVLAYHPKPKSKAAKKRKNAANRSQAHHDFCFLIAHSPASTPASFWRVAAGRESSMVPIRGMTRQQF